MGRLLRLTPPLQEAGSLSPTVQQWRRDLPSLPAQGVAQCSPRETAQCSPPVHHSTHPVRQLSAVHRPTSLPAKGDNSVQSTSPPVYQPRETAQCSPPAHQSTLYSRLHYRRRRLRWMPPYCRRCIVWPPPYSISCIVWPRLTVGGV